MALVRSGAIKKSTGIFNGLKKHMKLMTLKPVKKVLIRFDPFGENSKTIRDFNYLVLAKDITRTNLSCTFKTEVLTDRSEASVEYELVNGEKFQFKCANLTTLELFQLYNKHISPLAPKEEPVPVIGTKSEKKFKKK